MADQEEQCKRLSACLDEASKLVTEILSQPRSTGTQSVSNAVSQAVNHTRSMLSQSSTSGLFPRLNRRQRERLRGGSSSTDSCPPKKKTKNPEVKAFEFVLMNFEEDSEWVISSENTVLRGLIEINTNSNEADIRREIGKATRLEYSMVGDQDFIFLRASRRKVSVPMNCKSFDYRQLKLLAGQGAIYVKVKDGLDCLLVSEKEDEIDEAFVLPPPLSTIQNNQEVPIPQVSLIDNAIPETPQTIQQPLSYLSSTSATENLPHTCSSPEVTSQLPTPVTTSQVHVPEQQHIAHDHSDTGQSEAENSGNTVSVDDIVKETVGYCTKHNIDDPVEILRYFQKVMVVGRALEVENLHDCAEGETNFIMVDRGDIIGTGFEEIKSLSNFRLTLQVQFYGEMAEDYGGPRKEFFHIIIREIYSKYFEKGLREHIAEDYYLVGLLFALSIIQNGKIPQFIEENILKRIFSNSVLVENSSLWYLRNGLKVLGLYQIGYKMPVFLDILRPSHTNTLTVKLIAKLFTPAFSPTGSNSRMHENTVYTAFMKYLREVASGRRGSLTLSSILKFTTGSEEVLILGYVLQPSIEFPEVSNSFLPTANTCTCCLKLPRPKQDSPLPSRNKLFHLYDLSFANDYFGNK